MEVYPLCFQKPGPSSTSSLPQSPTSPTPQAVKKKRPEDFKFGKVLGEGSFSTVSSLVSKLAECTIASSAGNSFILGTKREKVWETGTEDKKVRWLSWVGDGRRGNRSACSFGPFLPQTPETQELPAEEAKCGTWMWNFAMTTNIFLNCILVDEWFCYSQTLVLKAFLKLAKMNYIWVGGVKKVVQCKNKGLLTY